MLRWRLTLRVIDNYLIEMELIPYSQFAKLRLKQFVTDGDIYESDCYEWLGGYGMSEEIRGVDFFRWERTPGETGALAICCSDVVEETGRKILEAIHLPLSPRMKLEAVHSVLGKPTKTDAFQAPLNDRQSDEFVIGTEQPYHLSSIVHEDDGLIYIAVVRGDVLSRIQAEEAAFLAELKAAQTS